MTPQQKKDLTPQQKKDLTPFLEKFPLVTLDDDGHPCPAIIIPDAEGDPVRVTFDADGIATINTAGYAYMMLHPEDLVILGDYGTRVRGLMKDWYESSSGKDWAEAQSL